MVKIRENVQSLTDTLYTKTNEASARSKREFTPKTLEDLGEAMRELIQIRSFSSGKLIQI